jgi:hypothetical protein
MSSPKRSRRALTAVAALAAGGALMIGGCGTNDVSGAQQDLQQGAEDFTQGIPAQARDARQQAEDAAQQLQDQLDATEGIQP